MHIVWSTLSANVWVLSTIAVGDWGVRVPSTDRAALHVNEESSVEVVG